jgi:hypothetical protein
MIDLKNVPSKSVRSVPPPMKTYELRVEASLGTDDLTPAAGKRIRVLGYHVSSTVLVNLTSTLRATLAFGTGHTTVPSKVICSYRHYNVNNPLCCSEAGLNLLGEVDEVVRLTNTTFSVGSVTTRSIVRYSEE